MKNFHLRTWPYQWSYIVLRLFIAFGSKYVASCRGPTWSLENRNFCYERAWPFQRCFFESFFFFFFFPPPPTLTSKWVSASSVSHSHLAVSTLALEDLTSEHFRESVSQTVLIHNIPKQKIVFPSTGSMYHEVLLERTVPQIKCMDHQEGMSVLFCGGATCWFHKAGTCNYFVADLEIYPLSS